MVDLQKHHSKTLDKRISTFPVFVPLLIQCIAADAAVLLLLIGCTDVILFMRAMPRDADRTCGKLVNRIGNNPVRKERSTVSGA